ncbi:MAG: hypothetical protein C4K58_03695 [Flavobacteriaceae bacterium]|nr:MAG: hypothetical protein C4K58_03695 [Flavobacteriaceae bacterium]
MKDSSKQIFVDMAKKALTEGGFVGKVQAIFRMLSSKDGYVMKTRTKLMIFGTLAYVLSPFDFLPEFFVTPAFGMFDDMALISFAFSKLNSELERFLAWEAENKIGDVAKGGSSTKNSEKEPIKTVVLDPNQNG